MGADIVYELRVASGEMGAGWFIAAPWRRLALRCDDQGGIYARMLTRKGPK